MVDGRAEPLGRKRLALVEQHAVAAGLRAGDRLAGPRHDLLGHALGLADGGDFFVVLGSPGENAQVGIAGDLDARAADEIDIEQRQRAVADDLPHARAPQTFGRGLGVGRFAVAGEPALGREVGGAGDLIDAGVPAGPLHLDVAEDQHRLPPPVGLRQVEEDHRVEHGEADAVVERGVGVRCAGHDGGGRVKMRMRWMA